MRQITVDGVVWHWVVGKSSLLVRQKDTNQRRLIDLWRLCGYANIADWDRDYRKRGYGTQVRPFMVAKFIKEPDFFDISDISDARVVARFIDKHKNGDCPNPILRDATHCDCCGEWMV